MLSVRASRCHRHPTHSESDTPCSCPIYRCTSDHTLSLAALDKVLPVSSPAQTPSRPLHPDERAPRPRTPSDPAARDTPAGPDAASASGRYCRPGCSTLESAEPGRRETRPAPSRRLRAARSAGRPPRSRCLTLLPAKFRQGERVCEEGGTERGWAGARRSLRERRCPAHLREPCAHLKSL